MPRIVRVGLIADTHGWLDPAIAGHWSELALILHAGDVGRPEVLEELQSLAPVLAVRGNVDGGALADLPLERVVEIGGRRIAVLHIAGSPRRPNRAALDLIRRDAPDVLLVGHSHIPIAGRIEGCLWINPGAAGREGFHSERSVALLEIEEGGPMRLFQIHLGLRGRKVT